MRSRGSQAALTVIFILFGFMLATQFRARPPIAGNLPYQRAEELSVLLKVSEDENTTLKQEVATLRNRITEMMAGADQAEALQEEMQKAMMLAGITAVRGPGISVEMTDSDKPAQQGQDPNVFLIHEGDIQDVVNAIFAAGAEAVSINGQRFVSTTEVVCAGNVIMINGVRVAPTFTILAIGDPKVLESGLTIRGGVIDGLKFWGIGVKVKQELEITVPAYLGALDFHFGQPVKEGGTK